MQSRTRPQPRVRSPEPELSWLTANHRSADAPASPPRPGGPTRTAPSSTRKDRNPLAHSRRLFLSAPPLGVVLHCGLGCVDRIPSAVHITCRLLLLRNVQVRSNYKFSR